MKERRAEGKLEGIQEGIRAGMMKSATKMVRGRFGVSDLTSQIIDRFEQLSEQQLDEFTSKFFEWQQPTDLADWLEHQETTHYADRNSEETCNFSRVPRS